MPSVPLADWKDERPSRDVELKPDTPPKKELHSSVPSDLPKAKYIDEDYIGGRVTFTDYTNKQNLTSTVIGGARWIRGIEDERLAYCIVMTSQMLVIFDADKPGPIAKKRVQKGQSLVRFIYNRDYSVIDLPLNSISTTNATAFLILTLTTLLLQTATFGTSTRARLVTIWLRKCRGLLPTRTAHPEVSIQLSGN